MELTYIVGALFMLVVVVMVAHIVMSICLFKMNTAVTQIKQQLGTVEETILGRRSNPR